MTEMKYGAALALALCCAACGGDRQPAVFELRSPRETGIRFANTLQEDDSVYNPTDFDYLYNGGGVGVGDLNNDGRPDLYFAGNMVTSRLYLNRGGLRFRDVTEVSNAGTRAWATGVSMVDINQDGLLDVYVCVAGPGPEASRANLLFVNQGVGPDGVPRFREEAGKYGIADTGYSTHAAFFDYDRDGDLDLYVLTNGLEEGNRNEIRPRRVNGESHTTDRLYRNDGGTFTDVSRQAGITIEGYGLGVAVSDLNEDGWPDVYVSNDFLGNDLVWINNGDGTFTDRAAQYLKHQSYNAMGNDVADFNNDGRVDIAVVDMLPPGNERRKMMVPGGNYDRFHMALEQGYQPQYVRNTLQLNQGPGPDGVPRFSEIGQLAGIHATDWSWAPLFADFDNDGLKDLFVSNGYRRDVTNLDYISYSQDAQSLAQPAERMQYLRKALRALPEVRLHNYLFRNEGDLTFSDRSRPWGMRDARFSNGAAYADLDGDGDLELVTNNLDGPASVYENRSRELGRGGYLRVVLRGPAGNRGGYGAKVLAVAGGRRQYLELSPYRGFQSSVDDALHFGLGAARTVDSLRVSWPDGTTQLLTGLAASRVVTVDHREARPAPPAAEAVPARLFRAFDAAAYGLGYRHQERRFADFKLTPLLPRSHSQEGPGMAVGDVDGNGLDDVFVGADRDQPRSLFLQAAPGRFRRTALAAESGADDMGALFFDADGDGDQDLYVVSGGSYPADGTARYQDRLYLNDGRGALRQDPSALPREDASGSGAVAADYDADGDLDLFVGGRIVPGEYPLPPRSQLLRNDSRPGAPRFTDVTAAAAPGLERAGLVTSALWTDWDGDGDADLLVAGEWMPLRFFRNDRGRFSDASAATGLGDTRGWWNGLASGDFDGDGDTDYVAGNLGLNSRFRASPREPLRLHAADFDGNGSVDPLMSYFVEGESYAVAPRDQLIDQMIGMKGRFRRYADYSRATLVQTLTAEERERAYVAEGVVLESSYLENLGGGRFARRPLPLAAQLSPVYGMLAGDRDGDGHLDLLLVGNSYATETQVGWYDAAIGSVLLGDGRGGFTHRGGTASGFLVEGDARGLAEVMLGDAGPLLLAAQNGDSLRAFTPAARAAGRRLRLHPLDTHALLTFREGRTRREELHYGSTYLSQSSRVLTVPPGVARAVVRDSRGGSRTYRF